MIERANKGLHHFVFQKMNDLKIINSSNSILDIGAGSGVWLKRFADIGYINLHGIDLETEQFLLKEATISSLNIDNYAGEIFGLFNVITSLELIEHLESPGNLFKLIDKNLSLDGIWIMSTPNIHSINARLRFLLKGRLGHFDEKSDPTHIYPVYHENFERILSRYSMKVDAIFSFPKHGSINYSLPIQLLAKLLQLFIPSSYFGDNLVYVIKRK